MRRIRVTGLVREANRVRQVLSQPMTRQQRDALARHVRDSLMQIDALLAEHHARPQHLPTPSRRAYTFLKQLDLSTVPLTVPGDGDTHAARPLPESVSYRGVRAFLDSLLDDIARSSSDRRLKTEPMCRVIRQTAERLETSMERDRLDAAHLKPESRQLVGWFRYFGQDGRFERYADAVARAQAAFHAAPRVDERWRQPLLVHFRPSSHLYRWRVLNEGTRIVLATPMIAFDDTTLRQLGRHMLGGRRHGRAVTEAMLAEPYQAVAVELEAATGIVEHTRGIAHDLVEVFDRVNAICFAGAMERPKLTWTRTLTGSTFGHYEFVQDQVWISSSLDDASVPAFVVDHVMHHELLHKKHGFSWQGARQHTHTAEFRQEERTFPRYAEACAFLEAFAVRK